MASATRDGSARGILICRSRTISVSVPQCRAMLQRALTESSRAQRKQPAWAVYGVQALADGDLPLAAFYAGALAHYIGDLGQFYHIMGSQSHWGSEDQTRRSAYEMAVESTIRFQTRSSTVFESFSLAHLVLASLKKPSHKPRNRMRQQARWSIPRKFSAKPS